MLLYVLLQLVGLRVARRKHDERLDYVAPQLVGLADDTGLRDSLVLYQGALDLERTDTLTRGLDNIVCPSHVPEVPVLVYLGGIAGVVPVVPHVLVVLGLVLPDLSHHGRPAGLYDQAALLALWQLLAFLVDYGRVDAWKWLAHRAWLYGHLWEVGYQYAAGLGLPPCVVEGLVVEDIQGPLHSLRVERLTDGVQRPEAAKVVLRWQVVPLRHQHPDSRRGGVPYRYLVVLDRLVPSLRVEPAAEADLRCTAGPGAQASVDYARHPSEVSGAPVHVLVVDIQDPAGRQGLLDDPLVRVNYALRLSGCAGGVQHELELLGVHRDCLELV